MNSRRRRRAWRMGVRAEVLCLWLLRLKGYRIVAHRLRTPVGEIDILARRGRVLAVVEVKARSDRASAAEAIDSRQRQRIGRAAAWYQASDPASNDLDIRFDAMLLAPGKLPLHIVGAWRADD